jgi:hypothetical protein
MPIKLNLVINHGQYNKAQRPNITINNNAFRNSPAQAPAPPPAAATPPIPPGVSMRRAINAPKTGCNSCRG